MLRQKSESDGKHGNLHGNWDYIVACVQPASRVIPGDSSGRCGDPKSLEYLAPNTSCK